MGCKYSSMPSFNSASFKPPLNLWHVWVIISHKNIDVMLDYGTHVFTSLYWYILLTYKTTNLCSMLPLTIVIKPAIMDIAHYTNRALSNIVNFYGARWWIYHLMSTNAMSADVRDFCHYGRYPIYYIIWVFSCLLSGKMSTLMLEHLKRKCI